MSEIKKRELYVICSRFFDFSSGQIVIGGVETYLTNLLPLFEDEGFICKIFQFGKNDEERVIGNCHVRSVGNSEVNGQRSPETLLEAVEREFDNNSDVLLFADHWMTVKNNATRSLSIQHGIHWDIPNNQPRNNLKMALSGARFTYRENQKLSYVNKVICVDYNFPNWYRAQVDKPKTQLNVIPNFSKVSDVNSYMKDDNVVKIIFARRLVDYRGTRVFAKVANQLLTKYSNIHITVAGSGPDARYMHEALDMWNDRVEFMQYTADQSLLIHKDKNIAVIPTIGSEGTSLSLLEAMAAQCAVVCSNVGGMTNIVIDDYNGLMVEAGSAEQLYDAISLLIDDKEKRLQLAQRGYDTVKHAFSYDKWKERWKRIISQL